MGTSLPRYRGGAEIHHRLIDGGSYDGSNLSVTYATTCDEFETLKTRLTRFDPTMGLIDPSRLVLCGVRGDESPRSAYSRTPLCRYPPFRARHPFIEEHPHKHTSCVVYKRNNTSSHNHK
jgi:hypothetical protein